MGKPTGLKYENGFLVKYTSYGRKRRNWKQDYRKRSRKRLSHIKICEVCGSIENLTVHHKTPLSKRVDISRENLIKVCRDCHDKVENGEVKIHDKECMILEAETLQKFIDSIKGYGIMISIEGEDVTIKLPSGKGFYQSFIGPIAKEQDIKIQPHGV